ncbi:MAG TPA: NADH-quinone oxidoreductase subunit J [Candidatus Sumerlaeota bacterium]|nr:MAG: NADH-quinone oxidoreductase subunit J [candidate division BRC1 bacterium ADurb.BinA292]HOE95858.1 NADH-quinone oxidoreductase subunit J [Candidatus Sumerlaeota bacterium]HOR26663.1 NADH-quinone oxidoreductase subunit J [Candidatus Sumerlaeota bacterium]HPK03041.1 NADH-quinone oxidoreductase subunit J [Candidatus Sumerlaeota bacterium]
MISQIVYGLLFVLALFSAMMVVLSPHAVYGALYLVLTMVGIAALFVLMNAQLAGVLQIIVYAGAIMVLFLFVIMLLNVGRQEGGSGINRSVRWLGGVLSVAFILQVIAMYAGLRDELAANYTLEGAQSIRIDDVARLLLTDYIYAFEMTSVLLLVAVIGAVVLARRRLVQGALEEGERRGF